MTPTQSRLLGVAILLSAIAFVMHITSGGDAAQDRGPSPDAGNSALAREIAQSRARFESGPYVANAKQLTDRENIQLIIIPEGYTSELDTRCVVYENSELRTSTITCSGPMFRPTTSGS
jgi:hypothetical protein